MTRLLASLLLEAVLVANLISSSHGFGVVIDHKHAPLWPMRTWSPLRANLFGQSDASRGLFGGDDDIQEQLVSNKIVPRQEGSGRFAQGKELARLRSDLSNLRENLKWAKALKDQDRIDDLKRALENGENRDPDIVYTRALSELARLAEASASSPETEATKKLRQHWKQQARMARAHLSRFQLTGLWVGNYGPELGQQLVNITYSGDSLTATKVTGNKHIPRGQISFTVNLSPLSSNSTGTSLKQLKIDQSVIQKADLPSGETALRLFSRFVGSGQMAKSGFGDPKFVEGHLVLANDQEQDAQHEPHFAFVWLPIGHQVVFCRPTPEQTISLLRNVYSQQDEMEFMREHVSRCFDMDMTESLARHHAQAVDHDTSVAAAANEKENGYQPGSSSVCFRRIASLEDLQVWETKYGHRTDKSRNMNSLAMLWSNMMMPWGDLKKQFESVMPAKAGDERPNNAQVRQP